MLPRFEIVHRTRPVDLVRPGSDLARPVAPYVAVTADLSGSGPASVSLGGGEAELTATFDDDGLALRVTTGTTTTDHRSRRFGRPDGEVAGLALSLTATHVVGYTREGDRWRVRARFDLHERFDPHDEAWLSRVRETSSGAATRVRAGRFGQLGLRDLRLVTHADGTPYREGNGYLLSATSAGPGAFATGHASVWALDPGTFALEHRADLFFRRPDRPGVYGDHACHLVRDDDRWLVAASTWGDFDKRRTEHEVAATLAETTADITRGTHVLDTRRLALPTTGMSSVGVWDPHLVRTDEGWLVGYVSARKYFRFHPVARRGARPRLAAGPRRRHRATGDRGHHPDPPRRSAGGCWRATGETAGEARTRGSRSSTSTCARSAASTRRTPATSRGPPCSSTTAAGC